MGKRQHFAECYVSRIQPLYLGVSGKWSYKAAVQEQTEQFMLSSEQTIT